MSPFYLPSDSQYNFSLTITKERIESSRDEIERRFVHSIQYIEDSRRVALSPPSVDLFIVKINTDVIVVAVVSS